MYFPLNAAAAEDAPAVARADGAAGAAHVPGGVPAVGLAQALPALPGKLAGDDHDRAGRRRHVVPGRRPGGQFNSIKILPKTLGPLFGPFFGCT